jgi:hypothetical protein
VASEGGEIDPIYSCPGPGGKPAATVMFSWKIKTVLHILVSLFLILVIGRLCSLPTHKSIDFLSTALVKTWGAATSI